MRKEILLLLEAFLYGLFYVAGLMGLVLNEPNLAFGIRSIGFTYIVSSLGLITIGVFGLIELAKFQERSIGMVLFATGLIELVYNAERFLLYPSSYSIVFSFGVIWFILLAFWVEALFLGLWVAKPKLTNLGVLCIYVLWQLIFLWLLVPIANYPIDTFSGILSYLFLFFCFEPKAKCKQLRV